VCAARSSASFSRLDAKAEMRSRPITILIAALGGEGGGVLAEWLVDAARLAGYVAQSTSIPGVAQRTGATTYYIEVFPIPKAALAGRTPVLSLLPVPGCVDLVVASELLEAVRAVQGGMVSADRTLLVASTSRTLTTVEKMAPGDGRFDAGVLEDVARGNSRKLVAFDMEAAARRAETVMSAVMFGAIAGSGVLPFSRAQFEEVVRQSGRGADASLRGFASAWDVLQGGSVSYANENMAAEVTTVPPHPVDAHVPAPVQPFARLGYDRLVEFDGRAYAELYVARLRRVVEGERQRDPVAVHDFALARETARFLALWMAFDDIVRVADLKVRAGRFDRVRREVAAGDGDIVRIVDHFKPGIPECAALLPDGVGKRLTRWDRARQARGKPPLAVALHLRTDTITGFLALRALAGLRWLRRRGARFAEEQVRIGRWLSAIENAAREDWSCGYEIALCGRLIKGYGATNERGKHNLAHIVEHLAAGAEFACAADRAAAIRQAREAALADEGGKALDVALVRHGAPPRAVPPQPILWSRKRPAQRAVRPG
jgi:indolepyruvate ferredoxin oxidoreductase beta subunit